MNIFYNFDDMYKKKEKDVALFDYTAKTSSRYVSTSECSNVDCFEGIINEEVPPDCIDYSQCMQYFNTMPIMNCIDNVPAASFLILDD